MTFVMVKDETLNPVQVGLFCSLEVIRNIRNNTTKAIGNIDLVTADKIKVLRVTFTENEKEYEATYLINADLDNYGRLNRHIYLKAGGTKKPGLEALFNSLPESSKDRKPG